MTGETPQRGKTQLGWCQDFGRTRPGNDDGDRDQPAKHRGRNRGGEHATLARTLCRRPADPTPGRTQVDTGRPEHRDQRELTPDETGECVLELRQDGTTKQDQASDKHRRPEREAKPARSRRKFCMTETDVDQQNHRQEQPGVHPFEEHESWDELAFEKLHIRERHEVEQAIQRGQCEVRGSDDPRHARQPASISHTPPRMTLARALAASGWSGWISRSCSYRRSASESLPWLSAIRPSTR